MFETLAKLPLLVTVIGLCALAMLLPAAHALVMEDDHVAGTFFLWSMLTLVFALMLAIAMAGQSRLTGHAVT